MIFDLAKSFWNRLFNTEESFQEDEHNYKRVFKTDRGQIVKVPKILSVSNDIIIYTSEYFMGTCQQSYCTRTNTMSVQFRIMDWNLPKYFLKNIGKYFIDVNEFEYQGFTVKASACEQSIIINFHKDYANGPKYLDSYEEINYLKDFDRLRKKMKHFVKQNKHLNFEDDELLIAVDISQM